MTEFSVLGTILLNSTRLYRDWAVIFQRDVRAIYSGWVVNYVEVLVSYGELRDNEV